MTVWWGATIVFQQGTYRSLNYQRVAASSEDDRITGTTGRYMFYCSDPRSVTLHLQNYGPTIENYVVHM